MKIITPPTPGPHQQLGCFGVVVCKTTPPTKGPHPSAAVALLQGGRYQNRRTIPHHSFLRAPSPAWGRFCCRPIYTPILKVDTSEAISKMAGLDGEGGRWDEFDIASEAFLEMVEEQKESLKGVLEEEVMELNQVSSHGRVEKDAIE